MKKIILLWLSILILFPQGCGLLGDRKPHSIQDILKRRPTKDKYVFDFINILEDAHDYSERYLEVIEKEYAIEPIIVSIPSLEDAKSIQEVAVKLFNNWQIGKNTGGRGILLLFAEKEKQIKLEVSYEIEDVFTDMFCGYVEDLQLRPYFLANNLYPGLLAVMEEIENRAHMKSLGNYTPDAIAQLDNVLLSGGAGAGRNLDQFEKENIEDTGTRYPAGKTPAEAWKILIQSWQDKVRDYNLEIYTEMTKLVYRDYQNLPDNRYDQDVKTYAKKPYKVLQDDNYAVIFFGNKKGWDNSPFLLCNTSEGWKYDIVHQRKYVRMGPSPDWGIERTNFPYIELLSQCPYYFGQDMPLEKEDIYRIEEDKKIAERIIQLEDQYKKNPHDFMTAQHLGRLYVITAMNNKAIPILKHAMTLNPTAPLPHKYLAMAYVDSSYQYRKAMEEVKKYLKKMPDDVFGYNLKGFLCLNLQEYKEAIKVFEKAIRIAPDNCYAYCKLSRIYGTLFLRGNRKKKRYQSLALEMLEKAKQTPSVDHRRIAWLEHWLKVKKIS